MADVLHIVTKGRLTEYELELFGRGLDRAFPIDDVNVFEDLLCAIGKAERLAWSRKNSPIS